MVSNNEFLQERARGFLDATGSKNDFSQERTRSYLDALVSNDEFSQKGARSFMDALVSNNDIFFTSNNAITQDRMRLLDALARINEWTKHFYLH